MIDLFWQTLDGTVYTMSTVFLMLFLTGIMNEMGLFQRFSYLARPWSQCPVCLPLQPPPLWWAWDRHWQQMP